MARSPAFRKFARLVARAQVLNENPQITAEQLDEHLRSRREFLKISALAATSLIPAVSMATAAKFAKFRSPVIILGGGIAGLTAAYYLTKAKIPCAIYEASLRVGGRMFTAINFNTDQMTCELGGEFVDSNHADLIELCKELDVQLDDFVNFDQAVEPNLYYFGGKYYTDQTLLPFFQPFAKKLATDQERAKQDKKFAAHIDQMSLEAYLKEFTQVDPWIIEMIRVAYVGESGLEASDQSASLMFTTLPADAKDGFKIYGDSDQSKKIRGGNIALIQKLEKYLSDHGVAIKTKSPVTAFKESKNGIELTFGQDKITAEKVISTIPFSVLRNIEGIFDLSLSPLKKKCIREMGYGTSGKLMIGYKSRLWRQGLAKGETKIPKSSGMVYTALPAQNIWETSREQKGNSGILTCYTAGQVGADLSAKNLHPFINDVNEIFPGTSAVHDGNFKFYNWTNSTWNLGAYACAKPGQVTEFGDVAGKPELKGRLLFAGEHAADLFQGFMNGGCRSGKMAALKIAKAK